MTAKHMETQQEITQSRTFHLMSERPKIALDVPNTGSQSCSVRSLHACAKQHWKQTLKLPTDSVQIFRKLVFTQPLNQTHKHRSSKRVLLGWRHFSLFPDEHVPSVLFQRQNLVCGKPRGDRTEVEIEQFPLCCILT